MTAPRKVDPDRDPVAILAAGKAVAGLSARPLATLTGDELERFETAAHTVLFAIFAERAERKEAAQEPHGKAGLRLVAQGGELLPAGERVLRSRKAAKARWSR